MEKNTRRINKQQTHPNPLPSRGIETLTWRDNGKYSFHKIPLLRGI